jgi:glutamine amidotransferase
VIALVDYCAGNLTSVKKALAHLGFDAVITQDPEVVIRSSTVILPGVGHFAATKVLQERGLTDAIRESIARGTPFLGICVGMQWMFHGSEEAAGVGALGMVSGTCSRFPETVKAPHVGWNRLEQLRASRLLREVSPGAFVYYTHSYRAPVGAATIAQSDYAGAFSAVVECGNAFGVQFHPEKSAEAGLRILANFCEGAC